MFSNLKIGTRLSILTMVMMLALVLVSASGLLGVKFANDTMKKIDENFTQLIDITELSEVVRQNLLTTTSQMSLGSITWEEAQQLLVAARDRFATAWGTFLGELDADNEEYVRDLHGPNLGGVQQAFDELQILFEARDRARLNLFMTNDFNDLIEPYFDTLQAHIRRTQFEGEQRLQDAGKLTQFWLIAGLAIAATGILIALLLSSAISRSIIRPVKQIADVVQRVTRGDYDARTQLSGTDELGELGQTFDQLLQDRMTALASAQRENEQLNNSVIGLLQAVFQLSQRDLTVTVPVTEDVTGPVADALNLLTDETAQVMRQVTQLADNVANSSASVKQHSDMVIELAMIEHDEVSKAATELNAAAIAMNRIAELAQASNVSADRTSVATERALETVTNTVNGINNTRDTIRETEKRIKRLGERSQEISGVVSIINSIAERTHILALNASMHAASAGEAGRGFAVVANEVQRLAENAREATAQIATLVSNIQTETADTVNAMNSAITQVVEGSRLAEEAGQQMKITQEATADLVVSVQQIAIDSQRQAHVSNELLSRAEMIQESTEQTGLQLREQTVETNNLVKYAQSLVESVRVFKLPQVNAEAEEDSVAPVVAAA